MIHVENLTKRYGDRLAVSDITFDVEAGDIVGFLGPNGAGKSTTLRMLTGYLAPTAGKVRVGGVDAVADPVGARRQIGYMPESVPLYPELRVEEYLRYRARLKGVSGREIRRSVDRALSLANVGDVRRRIIGQLSKGYRSRVGLADALVADPPLLVLDEPTAGLDPNQIRQVRDLIRGMAGEKTVLLSTHILPEVESTCGRVVIIHRGELVGEGEPGSLRQSGWGGPVLRIEARGDRDSMATLVGGVEGVRTLLDSADLDAADGEPLTRFRFEAESVDVAERVFAAVAKEGRTLRELRCEQTSLEDVFASLTTTDAVVDDESDQEVEQGESEGEQPAESQPPTEGDQR